MEHCVMKSERRYVQNKPSKREKQLLKYNLCADFLSGLIPRIAKSGKSCRSAASFLPGRAVFEVRGEQTELRSEQEMWISEASFQIKKIKKDEVVFNLSRAGTLKIKKQTLLMLEGRGCFNESSCSAFLISV